MTTERFRLRPRLAAGAAVAVAAVLAVPAVLSPGPAFGEGEFEQFSATAAADGIRVSVRVPEFLVVEDLVDGGGPTAQAQVDSVGGSSGFAAAPDPGQTLLSVPGLVAIATGTRVPVTYPFVTISSFPARPESVVDHPGVHLASRSGAVASEAVARLGTAEGGSHVTSEATVRRLPDRTVTAVAQTSTDVFRAGPVALSGVVAKATVTHRPGAEPERSATLELARMAIGDIPVEIGRDGLVVAGTTVPIDQTPAIRDALAQAGVTVEMLHTTETDDGVVAPGLQITATQPVPGTGVAGTVTYVLGRATAVASAGAVPPVELPSGDAVPEPGPGAPPVLPDPPAPRPDTAAGVPPDPGPPASSFFSAPDAPTSVRSADDGGPDPASGAVDPFPDPGGGQRAAVDGTAAAPIGGEPQTAAVAFNPARPLSTWMLFPVLLIGGVVMGAAAYAGRLVRGRTPWSS